MSDVSSGTISLQEAAARLGVHYMTIYRYVRLGLLPARKEGGTWRVVPEDLESMGTGAAGEVPRGEAPWAERLEARMVEGDVAGAWGVVEAALASGTEPTGVYTDMLAPALASIGDRWAAGDVAVEQEHLASAVASRLIGRLGPRFARRGRPRGTIVAAMPPGERHGFGVSMLADVLRGAGYAVLDLGPDTPVESLLAATRRVERLSAVCLSVAYDEVLPSAAEMIAAVRAELGAGVPVVVGGRAVREETVGALGADIWSDDPTDVVRLVEGFHASAAGTATG